MRIVEKCGILVDKKGGDILKTGLVLEGGAMRGMFTAGVIDVMMEHGIVFDGAIGVSAGACFGCNYKSKQIGRAIRYNEQFCKDKRYCSLHSLITTGDLYGADFCYRVIPEELDIFDTKTFDENPMEFYVTCTDVKTGKAVYKLCASSENYLDWMRASASMPLASRVVEINGGKYLDGGISDSVPLAFFESIGYEKNVVVLTQPAQYRKKKSKLMPILSIALRKYPNLLQALATRHNVYNDTISYIRQQEKAGKALVICPKEPLPVGHIEHDAKKLRKTYELGRNEAELRMAELKRFLEA